MSTTTRLEVMAEVGRMADALPGEGASRMDVEARLTLALYNGNSARDGGPSAMRRSRLLHAAAWAILALEAHDAEALQTTVDRSGHAAECDVTAERTWCVFACPARAALLAATKAGA